MIPCDVFTAQTWKLVPTLYRLSKTFTGSTYHSFQSVLTKRLSQGLYSQFSYTFSKALGDNGVRDPRNRQLSKGLLDIDRTHIVKANGTFDLPFGPGRAFLANAPAAVQRVVEGWELATVFSWVSGAPLSFRIDANNATGVNTLAYRAGAAAGMSVRNTADLVGALPKDLGKVEKGNGFVQYFSSLVTRNAPSPNFGGDPNLPNRFTNQVIVDKAGNIILQNPQPGTTGNSALNLPGLNGPASLGLDLALSKRIRISENKTFTVRADAVNALNRPIWGNPTTNINSTIFGRITTATGNRTITFNARVDF